MLLLVDQFLISKIPLKTLEKVILVKGICPECKVRNGDDSEKELYKCPLCGREFCSDHLNPKLAFFSARFNISEIKDVEYRVQLRRELEKENAHPCVPYTRKRLNELDQERRMRLEKLSEALDKSKVVAENRLKKERRRNIKKKVRKAFVGFLNVLAFSIFTIATMLPTIIYFCMFYFYPREMAGLEFLLGSIFLWKVVIPNLGYLVTWIIVVYKKLRKQSKWWHYLILLALGSWNWLCLLSIFQVTSIFSGKLMTKWEIFIEIWKFFLNLVNEILQDVWRL